jgi:FkbM family methyltransferase
MPPRVAPVFVSYAQNYEDVTLWRALRDVRDGFYIDVGAWDPDKESVTRAFSERGWRGINLEPVPKLHKAMQARRPRDINLLGAAGDINGTIEFFEIEGTGLSTSDGAIAARHAGAGFAVNSRVVEVLPLATVCERYAPPDIHFLKLDCEGGELAALAGADFTRFRPWIVLAEATEPATQIPSHDAWEPLLTNADYRFVWFDGLNRFYVASEHYERLAPKLAMPPNIWDNFVRASAIVHPDEQVPPLPAPEPAAMAPLTFSIEERIALAQRGRDCDDLPKVPDAGQVQTEPDGTRVQIMHNGLKVLADGYCGEWMTRLIRLCQGHHEPQEERHFHQAALTLPQNATMIELGGNWSYYSAWFLHGQPARRAVVLEPDPANRAVGERTMQLNGLSAEFVAGFAGATPAEPSLFPTERSGTLLLPRLSVPQLMADCDIEFLDLLHCDAQGAEFDVLEGCRDLFLAGRVKLAFVSTHAHPISGDPLTHQHCIDLLKACGAVIEAEHDAWESFSGDGLIVARFGRAPPGWRSLPMTIARRRETLFRDPCFDLAEAFASQRSAKALAQQVVRGVFEVFLSRAIDSGSLANLSQWLLASGDVAGFLTNIMKSPEFDLRKAQFEAKYLGRGGDIEARQPPRLPTGSPFACSALQLRLERDTPLGQAGDALIVPNDYVILPAILAKGDWDIRQIEFLKQRLDPARSYILLDIGANVGLFTRQVLTAFDNIGACHCIEPDPLNYQALCQNLSVRHSASISTYPVALGSVDGARIFFRDAENCGNNSLQADAMRDRPFDQISVNVVSAGPWFERHMTGDGPILWKSDTQGSDEEIVAATPWQVWRRVEMAIIEVWRIRKDKSLTSEFLDRVADMPNRRLGAADISVDELASYIAGDDWMFDDLYLWR